MSNGTIIHVISSLELGGAQAVLHHLVSGLPYTHHIVYVHDGPYRDVFARVGIATYRIDGFGYKGFMQLRALCTRIRPNLLHTSLWGANFLGRFVAWWLGIPIVIALHNQKAVNGRVRNALDWVAPPAQEIVAVCAQVQESFGYTGATVIRNGIGLYSGPVHDRSLFGYHADDFIIGSVGRFHPDKHQTMLIDAFSLVVQHFPNVRLMLLGSGEQEALLRAHVKRLQLDHCVTFIVGEHAHAYYQLFDCFVLTSKREGISMALLEAMQQGVVPLCAGDSHPVITHNSNGILVTHTANAFAHAIESLVRNLDKKKALGSAAQQTVMHDFNAQKMIQEYDQLFTRMGLIQGKFCKKELQKK